MPESTELLLTGFAPLLQIWGGICLLFFYLELLPTSPLLKLWDRLYKKVLDCCVKLITRFNDLTSSRDKLIKLAEYIDQTTSSKEHSTRLWGIMRTAVYNLGKFGFFHVSTILLYIGFEKWDQSLYPGLLLVNGIALIYIVINLLFYNKGIVQKTWGLYVCAALLVLALFGYKYFHCFQVFANSFNVSQTAVTLITLVVSTVAYFAVLLFDIFRSASVMLRCSHAVNRIESLFELMIYISNPRGKPFPKPKVLWARIKDRITRLRIFLIRLKCLFTETSDALRDETGREQVEGYIREKVDTRLWPSVEGFMDKFPPVPVKVTVQDAGTGTPQL